MCKGSGWGGKGRVVLEGGMEGGSRGDGSRDSLSMGEGRAVVLNGGSVFVVGCGDSPRCVLDFDFVCWGCLSVVCPSDLTVGPP